MTRELKIHTDFITLGQALKLADLLSSGGEVREFLANNPITVNGEAENRRGRKLFPGDEIALEEGPTLKIVGN